MDQEWTKNGPKWTKSGPKMAQKWPKNGLKVDQKWTKTVDYSIKSYGAPPSRCFYSNVQVDFEPYL